MVPSQLLLLNVHTFPAPDTSARGLWTLSTSVLKVTSTVQEETSCSGVILMAMSELSSPLSIESTMLEHAVSGGKVVIGPSPLQMSSPLNSMPSHPGNPPLRCWVKNFSSKVVPAGRLPS